MATYNFGYGDFCYQVTQSWGQLPDRGQFGKVSAVAVDSQDRVYVCQRTDHPLVVLDSDGSFVTTWGQGFVTEGHGIFVDPDDYVYVVDRQGQQVLKFSPEGRIVLALGNQNQPAREKPFNFPTDVWVSSTGDIYVCDGYGNSRVHRFSKGGDLVLSWGIGGSGIGEFKVPHSVSIDPQGQVYICDRENNRIQVFTADGAFVNQWTDFYRPTDAYYAAYNDAIYVTDHTPRLSAVDRDGNLLVRGQTCVDIPHGVCVDSRGDCYVVSNQQRRIDKYVHQKAAAARSS